MSILKPFFYRFTVNNTPLFIVMERIRCDFRLFLINGKLIYNKMTSYLCIFIASFNKAILNKTLYT